MSEENKEKAKEPAVEMVQITIDGDTYQAPKGGNLLEFMLESKIKISYFCYHPGLSVVAVCRQCLVEINKGAKLLPACQTLIQDGMAVVNNSEKVLDARRQLLEFTLVNHPIDCPVCDKAGECILQKHYMEWDHETSRVDHPKVHKPKRTKIGPRIMLDDERCILCSRCVRFCAEVAKSPQLVIYKRGHNATLGTAPGQELDNPYSLNVVDICPVGALTDRDFRFKSRVWELSATLSICNSCATGCQLEVHHKNGQIYRLVPRRTGDINENWICDFGRDSYKQVTEDRLCLPLVKGIETDWEEALGHVASTLQTLLHTDKQRIGFVLGADATNEDNFAAAKLAFDYMELDQVYLAAEPENNLGDDILRDSDPNPNLRGATACGMGKVQSAEQLSEDLIQGKLDALYVIGDRLKLDEAALGKIPSLSLLVVQGTHPSPIVERAHIVLPAAMWPEVNGTITNRDNKTQRLHEAVNAPEQVKPHWQILVQLARRMGLMFDFSSPEEIFESMKQEIETFQDADWGRNIPALLLRFAGSRG